MRGKFECPIYEMGLIRPEKRPTLNTPAKMFHFSESVYLIYYVHLTFFFSFCFVHFLFSSITFYSNLSFTFFFLHITLLNWHNLHLIMVKLMSSPTRQSVFILDE